VGKFGSGINFTGTTSFLVRDDDSDFDFASGDSFSMETWFKHNTASSQEVLVSKYSEAGYKLIMESDGDITCALDYDNSWTPADSVTSTAATYDNDQWHHVTCPKPETLPVLYVDGVSDT
jgi:hypothetical protein